VWNKKNAAAAPAKPNSFEQSDHIVFCSQIVRARTISCAKRPPRLAQVYGIVSDRCAHMHKSYDMCRAGTNSDTFRTECASQGGGLAQVFRARAHDLWKTQNFGRIARMHVHFLRHLHFLFHTEPPITRVWDRSDLAQNDGNMSTRENRELWGETKQHRGMEGFLVQRIRSRNECHLHLFVAHVHHLKYHRGVELCNIFN